MHFIHAPSGHRRLTKVGAALAAVVALLAGTVAVAAASVSTDAYYYNLGDTVQITGDQMSPGENVTVDVFLPDGSLSQEHVVVADANGDFTDSYTLALDAPGGIYTVVATGQSSGSVFTTTFDPFVLTINNPTSPKTYGDVSALSGNLSNTGGPSVNDKGVDLSVYTAAGCSSGGVSVGSTTTDSNGDWSFNYRFDAGTWYIGATSAGNSSACSSQLVVNKADTDTSITNSPVTTLGTGGALDVDYLVESARGVDRNTAGGTVSISQQTGPSGGLCPTAASDTLSAAQSDSDGTGGNPDDGFSATGTLTCHPDTAGTYTYQLEYTGDDNYNGSNSDLGPQLTVSDVTVQVCPAAPAIAAEYLKAQHVRPGSAKWQTVITDIAHQTGSKGDFWAKGACDAGYADAVTSYIHTTYNI